MPSFPVAQFASSYGTGAATFGSNSVAGNSIIAQWSGYSSSDLTPTSCTDNNGNTYSLVSTSYSNNSAASCIFVANNIKITPNNPITVSFATVGGIGTYSPSVIIAEITISTPLQILGQDCAEQDHNITFLAGQIAGNTTGQISVTFGDYVNFGNSHNTCVLFMNQFNDMCAFLGDYDSQGGTAWTVSPGTIITETYEGGSGGRSAVLAFYDVVFSTGCGTVPPPGISLTCGNPPSGIIGVAYTHTFMATGGTPPYTYAITSGSLPPGLTLSSSGVITGTPTTSGSYSFTVTATDSIGNQASANCSISVCPGGITGSGGNYAYYSRH